MSFSKIDDTLSIYKQKNVVLYGAGAAGIEMGEILQGYGIPIVAVCDCDESKWGTEVLGKKVISPDKLQEIADEDTLIQLATDNDHEIERQLMERGIHECIFYRDARPRLRNIEKYRVFQKDPEFYKHYLEQIYHPLVWQNDVWEKLLRGNMKGVKQLTFLCMPPKTADHTLMATLKEYGHEAEFLNFWHTSYHMETSYEKSRLN